MLNLLHSVNYLNQLLRTLEIAFKILWTFFSRINLWHFAVLWLLSKSSSCLEASCSQVVPSTVHCSDIWSQPGPCNIHHLRTIPVHSCPKATSRRNVRSSSDEDDQYRRTLMRMLIKMVEVYDDKEHNSNASAKNDISIGAIVFFRFIFRIP